MGTLESYFTAQCSHSSQSMRALSAVAKAKICKTAKKQQAKFTAQAKKVAG
jgi:hypothetical protein